MEILPPLGMRETTIHSGNRKEKDNVMIAVRCKDEQFFYDIHSLVKAFYPAEDVKVFIEGQKDLLSSKGLPELFISCNKDNLTIQLLEQGKIVKEEQNQNMNVERPEYKNTLKQMLYTMLSDYTGKILPWGTLTGIRPTKIAYSMLESGKTKADVISYMQKHYYASKEKSILAVEIAKRELHILENIHYEKGYSLYIGIPFCPTTCLYCSFTSFPICAYKKQVADYLKAVEKEILYVEEQFKDKILDSVYIGGGTPTTLEPEELEELLSFVKTHLDFRNVKEFTVEAGRADSITKEKLMVLRQYGVTRISVNPQTMQDETLKLIGRRHTVDQVKEAFKLARTIGFDNINMDLILGLPNETIKEVANTLEEVKKLGPDSLTIHSLAIKRASKLHQWIEENGISCMNNTDEMMHLTEETAKEMGLLPYYLYRQKNMSGNFENVGYAKEGKFGLYNILIMEEVQTIVALGAGTVTKRVYPDGRIERCDNVKDVSLYIEKMDEMIERKKKLFI